MNITCKSHLKPLTTLPEKFGHINSLCFVFANATLLFSIKLIWLKITCMKGINVHFYCIYYIKFMK